MRLVIDTNVFVSALLFKDSLPAKVVFASLRDHTVFISSDFITEYTKTIHKKKLRKYFSLQEALDFLLLLRELAQYVEPSEKIIACRDPRDNHILELAVTAQAEYIISGDDDLLALHEFRTIPIYTPRQFYERDNSMSDIKGRSI